MLLFLSSLEEERGRVVLVVGANRLLPPRRMELAENATVVERTKACGGVSIVVVVAVAAIVIVVVGLQ